MLTVASKLEVMHRLGRAMADPTRSRILLNLLDGPSYPANLAEDLGLTRQNVSNHLTCLRDCGIVVAEPVTHANAALNAPEEQWRQLGMEVLEPNEEMALTMILAIEITN